MKLYKFIFRDNIGIKKIRNFGSIRLDKTFKELLDEKIIEYYFDLNNDQNSFNMEDINKAILEDNKIGILTIRYVDGYKACLVFIGNLFEDIVCLTDLLNLPKGNKNWRERVKLRKEYIDKELKKDPNKVFWDYADYLGGAPTKSNCQKTPLQTLTNIKISTKGLIVNSNNNVIGEFNFDGIPRRAYVDLGCKVLNSEGKAEYRTIRRHRMVACTFVPISDEHYKGYIENNDSLVPDHLDSNKQNDVIENLEWVTRGENTGRMLDREGITKQFILTIAKGNRLGEKYIINGTRGLREIGLEHNYNRWRDGKIHLGCLIRVASTHEIKTLPHGFDDKTYFEQFKRVGFVGTNKPVQFYFIPVIGPFKGKEFKVTGNALECVLRRKRHRIKNDDDISLGCIWRYETVEKAVDDYSQELLKWIEDNRRFILHTDGVVKRQTKEGIWEYGHITDFIKGGFIPAITRMKVIDGITYYRCGLKEALENGYTY